MHEIALAQGIINEANKHGNIRKIKIEVGELAHITAEELKQAMESLVKWDITTTEKKSSVKCHECGYRGAPKIVEKKHGLTMFVCPKCGYIPNKVIEGDKIIIKEVEFE